MKTKREILYKRCDGRGQIIIPCGVKVAPSLAPYAIGYWVSEEWEDMSKAEKDWFYMYGFYIPESEVTSDV